MSKFSWNRLLKNDKTNYQQFTDLLKTDKPDERQIMTYVSCFYHAFQGAMQVNVKSLKMTNRFFFTWITLETTKSRPYCRYIYLTSCVMFETTTFWIFRFSSLCYARWPSNNDICVIVLSYICWCSEGVNVNHYS